MHHRLALALALLLIPAVRPALAESGWTPNPAERAAFDADPKDRWGLKQDRAERIFYDASRAIEAVVACRQETLTEEEATGMAAKIAATVTTEEPRVVVGPGRQLELLRIARDSVNDLKNGDDGCNSADIQTLVDRYDQSFGRVAH